MTTSEEDRLDDAVVPTASSPLLAGEDDLEHYGKTTVDSNRQDNADDPDGGRKRKKAMWIMPALAIGVFLFAADQTIVVSTYGKIGSEMRALNNTSWIATAYFLTQTSFQPLYGKLSDIFGRKTALLFSFGIFGLGSLFCGLARSMAELITARALAGIGGGGLTTLAAIVLSDVIPLRDRGTWQGYSNLVFATGQGIGAPLGSFLADYTGWRWWVLTVSQCKRFLYGTDPLFTPVVCASNRSFLLQVPLITAAFISVYFVPMGVLSPLDPKQPRGNNDEDDASTDLRQNLKRVDFLGALILILAVFTLLLGLDQGSNISWHSPVTVAGLCASLVLFTAFMFVETRIASEPVAPGHIIFDRTLLACLLCNFFSFAAWLALTYYVPLYWQAAEDLSATQAGVRLLPGIVAQVSGSLFAGYVMKKTGRYYWLTVICYSLFTIGVIPLILFTGLIKDSLPGVWAGMIMCGFSNGIGNTSSLVALISNTTPQDQTIAIACLYLFRSLGSAVGISTSATVVQQSLRTQLLATLGNIDHSARIDVNRIVENVRHSLDYIHTLPPQIQVAVRKCFAVATRASFTLNAVVVAGAVVSALLVSERRLN
ncbi:MAG: hypothetical protein M1816_001079 [Peltula sp. TS41687]|nr:MAG: hypothetical protein M1816_001079 [Peltula sp. TS41687]